MKSARMLERIVLLAVTASAAGVFAQTNVPATTSSAPAAVSNFRIVPEANAPADEALILTPVPSPKPRINGTKVFGVRPGNPFLFTIAATGQRPMAYSAKGLPAGLTLDARTGRISGKV